MVSCTLPQLDRRCASASVDAIGSRRRRGVLWPRLGALDSLRQARDVASRGSYASFWTDLDRHFSHPAKPFGWQPSLSLLSATEALRWLWPCVDYQVYAIVLHHFMMPSSNTRSSTRVFLPIFLS